MSRSRRYPYGRRRWFSSRGRGRGVGLFANLRRSTWRRRRLGAPHPANTRNLDDGGASKSTGPVRTVSRYRHTRRHPAFFQGPGKSDCSAGVFLVGGTGGGRSRFMIPSASVAAGDMAAVLSGDGRRILIGSSPSRPVEWMTGTDFAEQVLAVVANVQADTNGGACPGRLPSFWDPYLWTGQQARCGARAQPGAA